MIREIAKDKFTLSTKSKECFFTKLEVLKNTAIAQDMLDTAVANQKNCIGLASNQIGEFKRIIVVHIDGAFRVMVNPSFTPVRSAGIKRFKEGCLSYPERMFVNRVIKRRFRKIHVTFYWLTGRKEVVTLKEFDAVIVQHEIDHLNGVTEGGK